MGPRRGVPRELGARTFGACTRAGERVRVAEELANRLGQSVDVAGRHDTAGSIGAHRLGEPADVVDDCGDTGTERLEQCTGLVELCAVGKDGDGRLGERAVELGLRQVTESPLDSLRVAETVERHRCVARDEKPCVRQARGRRDRVGQPLVGPDDAEREQRRAVVVPRRRARVDGMRDDARVDTEVGQGLAAPVAVDHDAVEPREDAPPEVPAGGRAPRQEVVRSEDRRCAKPKVDIGLRQGEPLQVQHVGARERE